MTRKEKADGLLTWTGMFLVFSGVWVWLGFGPAAVLLGVFAIAVAMS